MSDLEEVRIGEMILAFDSRVLELFGLQSESYRIHAGMIEGIEYSEGRLLGLRVTIKTTAGVANVNMSLSGDEDQVSAARELLERAAQGPRLGS